MVTDWLLQLLISSRCSEVAAGVQTLTVEVNQNECSFVVGCACLSVLWGSLSQEGGVSYSAQRGASARPTSLEAKWKIRYLLFCVLFFSAEPDFAEQDVWSVTKADAGQLFPIQ